MVAAEDPPIDELFRAVVDIIHALPPSGPVKVTTGEKLTFYGLYKQATEGPCTKPKPGFWNVIEGYKWDAWNKLGEKDGEEAKKEYISRVRHKIRKVVDENKGDANIWIGCDDWERLEPVMLPKMRMLDPELVKEWGFHEGGPNDKAAVENGEKKVEVNENGHSDGLNGLKREINRETEVVNCLSDDDYSDAVDSVSPLENLHKKASVSFCESPTEIADRNHRHIIHRASAHLPSIPSSSSSSAFTRYAMELQQTVSVLSDQINRLSNSMVQQNAVIKRLVENSTAVMLFGMTWKNFFFLIVWPFVVHFFMRRFFR